MKIDKNFYEYLKIRFLGCKLFFSVEPVWFNMIRVVKITWVSFLFRFSVF